jgi:hypothetical protein
MLMEEPLPLIVGASNSLESAVAFLKRRGGA